MNQWKNTKSVLTWFNNIADKDQHSFIAFDVVDFYPSISIELLDAALDFASNYDIITDEEREIIMHAKTSCLHSLHRGIIGVNGHHLLRIASLMLQWAASCELVGSYLLHLITTKHGNNFY
ncbi:Hypothetical predicted protein [Paramuricea clavata]|uniref:Uncharacterized protein n=1 Tax=Paramuricea clavata TaxID=317549 RepID=A0A7D9E7L6_PARCT|nr:Hypothetical predicted protein [Paramuricea clavata]